MIKKQYSIIRTLFAFLILIQWSCAQNISPDLIIHNGKIYPVSSDIYQEAIAIKDGKIISIGLNKEILSLSNENTILVDAKLQFVIPGFIEGHGHFSSLGHSKNILNFNDVKNWDDIVSMVRSRVKERNSQEWIVGRGWHQEKWDKLPLNAIQGYPYHYVLSDVSPNNPVLLNHASGHSLFANQKAMHIAGITKEMSDPIGGTILRDKQGNPTGVFTETAMDLIQNAYQNYLDSLPQDELLRNWYEEIKSAEQTCIENGITSFQDAGSTLIEIERYKKLAMEDSLQVRLWVMLYGTANDLKQSKERGMLNPNLPFFQYNAMKAYVDGALGSRGAWMLEPYSDQPDIRGHNTMSIEDLTELAILSKLYNMQLCSHAIGDKGNQEVLNVYQGILNKEDKRWRIEHAQHLHIDDIPRFKELNVLASMQTNHCTSDAPYVEKRLGYKRAEEGAYAWRSLLAAGARINIGTDVPVEDIDPIENYYAAVTRKTKVSDEIAFFPKQNLTRKEALYGYTLANAYAAFQDKEKGSLDIGKMADIVILSNDLLTCEESEILNTKIVMTIIDGKVVYKR